MLAGIVKKNAIMMIDFAIQRQAEGRTPIDAVHEACLERFRPIIMTTMAAFFGSLPLAVGFGADAASRQPLGLAICGGLIVSQLVTLFVTPVTYIGFEWFQNHVLDRIPFFARRHKDTAPACRQAQATTHLNARRSHHENLHRPSVLPLTFAVLLAGCVDVDKEVATTPRDYWQPVESAQPGNRSRCPPRRTTVSNQELDPARTGGHRADQQPAHPRRLV